MTPTPPAPSPSRAFSLPEVTLAIGILGLSLTALLGLIPSVMDNMRNASNLIAETRIVSEITGTISLSDWGEPTSAPHHWSNLSSILTNRWYFDDQANPIAPGDLNFNTRLSYVATAELASESGNSASGDISLPSDTGSTPPSTHAKAFHVRIAATHRRNIDFDDPAKYTTYLTLIARQF